MIENGISPSKILLFTFTKKAANEIKERIRAEIGNEANYLTIGTYHSVCCRILRRYARHLGHNQNFSIYDDDDKMSVIKDIAGKDEDQKIIAYKIADYKKKFLTPSQAINIAETNREKKYAHFYELYQQTLMKQNCLDFD